LSKGITPFKKFLPLPGGISRERENRMGQGGDIMKKLKLILGCLAYCFGIFMAVLAFCPVLIPIFAVLVGGFLLFVMSQIVWMLFTDFVDGIVAKREQRRAIKYAKEMDWIE
jgi:divalent metal cation (Fe/Co/Zn/Cd) transporter